MKTSSPAFESLHSLPNKELRLVVKIDFPTPVYFTSHSDISIPGATVFASSLFRTSSTSAKLNPDEARTEIGTISFEIIDKDGAVTQHFRNELANNNGLKGQFVELYSGYAGLPFADFRLEQTQIIDKSISHDGGTYRIQCRDIQREMRKDIFDLAKTRLSATVEKGANTISVYDTNAFELNPHGTSYGDQPGQSLIYFKIKYKNGFEICSATGKTANTFTGVTRGLFGTSDIKHEVPQDSNPDNGPEVVEFVYLELPAPKLAYAVLTGKLIGEANTIPSGWNLGIPESFVDIDDFTGIGTDIYDPADDSKGFICRFESIEKTDGKRFLETQVCFPTMFFTVKANGKIGLRRMNGVLSNADYIDTLDASNITKCSDLEQDLTRVHSVLEVLWSWYEFQGRKPQFYRRNSVFDYQSLVTHNKGKVDKPLTIQLKGLHNSRHTYTTLKNLFDSLRDRYAGPPLGLTVDLLPSKNGLEIGDLVHVNLEHLRDIFGDDTLNRTMEIQQVTIDQMSGKITTKLFGSSDQAGPISDGASYVLPDGWYSSEGTNGSSVLSIDGAGNLTANGTLTGGATTRAIYYYIGDLTIPSGRTLTITENVELRVMGHLQVDGEILGGSTTSISKSFLGVTQGGSGLYDSNYETSYASPAWRGVTHTGNHNKAPPLDIENDGGVLRNVPADMRGSGGGRGGDHLDAAGESIALGGAGGAGGASLVVVARGMALGASGELAMNGAPGQSATGAGAGAGGGGAPGCFYFLQDGSQGTTPFLSGKVTSKFGAKGSVGRGGKGGIVLGDSTARIIFIPQSRTPYPDYIIDENILTGAGRITRGPTFPDNPNEGDVHYDEANQNHPYRWNGSNWISLQDGEILDLANQAQATANAANQAAVDAQADANAANLDISRMSSDGYLTPVEKKRLIREVEEIHEEETDIVAKADIYGITAEKNNYQQDIVDLDNYLATLDSPVLWNNLSGSTLIPDYAWFKSYFGLVYATRQKLLNKIAEKAGEYAGGQLYTGDPDATHGATAEQARQLGRGTTVFNETFNNVDSLDDWFFRYTDGSVDWIPMSSTSALRHGGGSLKCGSLSGTRDRVWAIHNQRIPFNPDLLYKITFHVFETTGSQGDFYAGVQGYDSAGNPVASTGLESLDAAHYVAAHVADIPVQTRVVKTGYFRGHASSGASTSYPDPQSPGPLHDSVRFFSPMFVANAGSGDPTGQVYIDAVIVEAFDNTTMRNVHTTIVGINALRDNVGIDQGDGNIRRAPFGLGGISARDGSTVNFGQAFNQIPRVRIRGGLTYSTTMTGKHANELKAINLSTSGFTVSAKVRELAGSVVLRTDSSPVAGGGGYDYAMHKSQSAQAWDDNYTFQFDVTVNAQLEGGEYFGGTATVYFYTNNGSGWVQRGSQIFSVPFGQASKTWNNNTKTVNVDGLTNHGGYEFAIEIVPGVQAASASCYLDNVKYETASAPAEETATPSGVSDLDIEFLAGE